MSNALATITKDIYGTRETFASVLTDKSVNFEREAEFAIQVLAASDYALGLAMKNRQSVIDAVTNIAAIGISLNPATKHAYLVPRDGKICLDISYRGLMALATSGGAVRWAQSQLVYANDTFALNGVDQPPTHTFDPFSKDRGEIVGVYVVAKTAANDYLTEAMSIGEVHAIRERSSAWQAWVKKQKSCPWVTDEGEMIRKTCVKRASKYWPEVDRLARAIHYLNAEAGEGISMGPPESELAAPWLEQVQRAESTEALKAIWQAALVQVREARDRVAYEAIKTAVSERSEALRILEETTIEGQAE